MVETTDDLTTPPNRSIDPDEKIVVRAPRAADAPTGPYGHGDAAEEGVRVEVEDGRIVVPWTGIKKKAYDYHRIPDDVDDIDMDRITLADGDIHAEADLDDGALIELVRESGSWTLHYFDEPGPRDGEIVHWRDAPDPCHGTRKAGEGGI
jgi:hypothetical protein